jgi:phosphoenolpyruvate synthase/pyruvate phosphate dikinase
MPRSPERHIRWFAEPGIADVPSVGSKSAALGVRYREPTPQGVKVPDDCAFTAEVHRHVLDQADACPRQHAALDGLDARDVDVLSLATSLVAINGRSTSFLREPHPAETRQEPARRETDLAAICEAMTGAQRRAQICRFGLIVDDYRTMNFAARACLGSSAIAPKGRP